MKSDIALRIGRQPDALCIGVLAAQVFLDTYAADGIRPDLAREVLANYSADAFSRYLADGDTTFILAERDGALLAFCEVARHRPCPVAGSAGAVELVRLYVQPNAQRQGLGRALLGRAENLAVEAGEDSLWLTAWTGNDRALAFYRAHGYESVGLTTYTFEGQTYENHVMVRSAPRGAG